MQEFGGQWLKEMGDGLLLSFPSSYDAVRCAIRIQKAVEGIEHLVLRIGIHQSDVVQTETDVLGSGVNIASRVETVAPPGGVAVSDKVQPDIAHHADLSTQSIGFPKLKGIELAPESPMVHTAKGYLHYWGLGEFDKALVEFGIAWKTEPSPSQHIVDIAWVQRAKGDLSQAFASMDAALKLNPQSNLIFREVGFTHIVAKN